MRTTSLVPSLVLMFSTGVLGCAGSSSRSTEFGVVGSEVPLDQRAPRGAQLSVSFESAETGDDDPPGASVSVRLVDETGDTVVVALVDTIGHCSAAEAAPGGFASFLCWWAGTGVKLHARAERGELVIYREDVYEEAPEDASRAVPIHRFLVSDGAVMDSPAP